MNLNNYTQTSNILAHIKIIRISVFFPHMQLRIGSIFHLVCIAMSSNKKRAHSFSAFAHNIQFKCNYTIVIMRACCEYVLILNHIKSSQTTARVSFAQPSSTRAAPLKICAQNLRYIIRCLLSIHKRTFIFYSARRLYAVNISMRLYVATVTAQYTLL